jgi:heme exporter protein D
MSQHKRPFTWTAAAATLLVAIIEWAATTSNRVAALEANETAHERRIEKAESDANQYRQDMGEIRDRISRIEGYLKRLTQ